MDRDMSVFYVHCSTNFNNVANMAIKYSTSQVYAQQEAELSHYPCKKFVQYKLQI